MNFNLTRKFAFKNLNAYRLSIIPFIISQGIIFIIFNIIAGLIDNEYVRTRHEYLLTIIEFAMYVVAILVFIFIVYSTNFLIKRRYREFSLYSVLGLEKKHIRRILYLEFFILYLIILIIAVVGGYIFSEITFLGLNKILKDVGGRNFNVIFSVSALKKTLFMAVILYIFTIIKLSINIHFLSPIKLLFKSKKSEGEPKSRYILMIIGVLFLVYGYYELITVKTALSALVSFFNAGIIIIIATYLLYISFTVIFLKYKKKRKSYYKQEKFLSISGLLYRIKSNAVSLASISILSAGIMMSLIGTISIYCGIENSAKNIISREYEIAKPILDSKDYNNETKKIKEFIYSTVDDKNKIKNIFSSYQVMVPFEKEGNEFKKTGNDINLSKFPYFLILRNLDGYNAMFNKNITLEENEVLLTANQKIGDIRELKIGDKIFKVRQIENIVPSNYAVETFLIVAKDLETIDYISKTLTVINPKTEKEFEYPAITSVSFDNDNVKNKEYVETLKNKAKDKGYEVEVKSERIDAIYELNGGFLFLGAIFTIIFTIFIILITYYKKLAEAYDDRDKYDIMRKLGITDSLIKKTTSSQIAFLFFSPIVVAIVHCIVTSRLIYNLLLLFAFNNLTVYIIIFISIIAFFMVIYFIIYKLTSKVYLKIIG